MRFLFPAGLWLLLGIPVLIVIYLIRTQHEDRKVSSTYIWQLSEKFAKKRIPLQIFSRILLLILQILAVTLLALAVARPVIEHRSQKDYILILDASASMQIVDENGVSRFEKAKAEAQTLAKEVSSGHRVSLIYAGAEPMELLSLSDDEQQISMVLQNVSCTWGSCDLEKAFAGANELAGQCPDPQVILYTDFTPERPTARITVRDFSRENPAVNLAVTNVSVTSDGTDLSFAGKLHSEGFTGKIPVGLKIDGETVDALEAEMTDGAFTEVRFRTSARSYETAEIFFAKEDAQPADNAFVFCRKVVRQRKVLLVSATPFYLHSALSTLEGCSVTVASSLADANLAGYDLYVFEGDAPASLPEDGSSLLFHCETLPLGISSRETIENETYLLRTQDCPDELFADWGRENTTAARYAPLLCNASFFPVLSCAGDTTGAVKKLPDGRAVCVFALDLHDTNLPLQGKFLTMIYDLCEYCAPSMLQKTAYDCGSVVTIYRQPGLGSAFVKDPEGEIRTLSEENGASRYEPELPGLYTAAQAEESGTDALFADFFVRVPASEYEGTSVQFPSIVSLPDGAQTRDATAEITLWAAVILLVLLLLEWGIYYVEQR